MEYSKKYGKSLFAKHLRKTKGKWTKPIMANSKSRLKTKSVMLDVILYDSIEKKNILESQSIKPLSSEDSLKHCLDMLDFMAAFSNNLERPDYGISWIILEMNSHDK